MESIGVAILFLAIVAGLWFVTVYGPVRASVDTAAEAEARSGRPHPLPPAIAALWVHYEHIAHLEVGPADFREAGWSESRAREFFGSRFAGRDRVALVELRPHMADLLVRDVLDYRRKRFDAARRYHAIRYTWINVDDAERKGLIPPELRPLICERERQSGKLVWSSDLFAFIGRPVVRDLLEQKLDETGARAS